MKTKVVAMNYSMLQGGKFISANDAMGLLEKYPVSVYPLCVSVGGQGFDLEMLEELIVRIKDHNKGTFNQLDKVVSIRIYRVLQTAREASEIKPSVLLVPVFRTGHDLFDVFHNGHRPSKKLLKMLENQQLVLAV
ncbi:MAG: hypothetical protein OEX02_08780 [Cyclobacteriaceae bacterium]|nr:hypothetical protein [Cyclobacteriaceae bacterium]